MTSCSGALNASRCFHMLALPRVVRALGGESGNERELKSGAQVVRVLPAET